MLRDGFLHFSDLKHFARSPAHYRHALTLGDREETAAMRIGTATDRLLLSGDVPPVYDGQRRGNDWKAFEASHPPGTTILTATEFETAKSVAAAVMSDRLAMHFLTGRHQVPLTWKVGGIPCRTRGIDVVGDSWISDLKATHTAEPRGLQWHARRMLWNAQMAWYEEACKQSGISTNSGRGLYLVCVEAARPHPVTVLHVSPAALEDGRRCIAAWLERYRVCVDSGHWPGYTQAVVELEGGPDESGLVFDDA